MIRSVGQTCLDSRGKYIAIQEDVPEGWSIGTTLNMLGLGVLAPGVKTPAPAIDPEVAKEMFANLYVEKPVLLGFGC